MEMKLESNKKIFGEVFEITAANYLQEVNQAGDGIWVVLLLYRQGYGGGLRKNSRIEFIVPFFLFYKDTNFAINSRKYSKS